MSTAWGNFIINKPNSGRVNKKLLPGCREEDEFTYSLNKHVWENLGVINRETYERGDKYTLFIFSQASERAGILNPRIWLANHTRVTGPAFYDTAHGPDFFPAA